jgi:hypothetical protein
MIDTRHLLHSAECYCPRILIRMWTKKLQFGALNKSIERKEAQATSESVPRPADSLRTDVPTRSIQGGMAINSLPRRDSAHLTSEEFNTRGSIVSSGSLGLSEQNEREIAEIREKTAKAADNILSLCEKSLETGTGALHMLRGQGERIKHSALNLNQAKQASNIAVKQTEELRRANTFIPIPNPFTSSAPDCRGNTYLGTGHAAIPKQIASRSKPSIEWHHGSWDFEPDDKQENNSSIEKDEQINIGKARRMVSVLGELAREIGQELDQQIQGIAITEIEATEVNRDLAKSNRVIRRI